MEKYGAGPMMHQARTARVPWEGKGRCRLAARPLACLVLLFASVAAAPHTSASEDVITRDPDASGLTVPAGAERVTAPTRVIGTVDGSDLAGWRLGYPESWLAHGEGGTCEGRPAPSCRRRPWP